MASCYPYSCSHVVTNHNVITTTKQLLHLIIYVIYSIYAYMSHHCSVVVRKKYQLWSGSMSISQLATLLQICKVSEVVLMDQRIWCLLDQIALTVYHLLSISTTPSYNRISIVVNKHYSTNACKQLINRDKFGVAGPRTSEMLAVPLDRYTLIEQSNTPCIYRGFPKGQQSGTALRCFLKISLM